MQEDGRTVVDGARVSSAFVAELRSAPAGPACLNQLRSSTSSAHGAGKDQVAASSGRNPSARGRHATKRAVARSQTSRGASTGQGHHEQHSQSLHHPSILQMTRIKTVSESCVGPRRGRRWWTTSMWCSGTLASACRSSRARPYPLATCQSVCGRVACSRGGKDNRRAG